ncbi:MAG: NAD(P)H-dependent flavin oxidoreductase [Candidatus Helarchaeota archaeon]
MIWHTKISEMIGCKYPILLGAFAGYDNSILTAKISDVGAFGVLTASAFETIDEFKNAILRIKEETKNPFGINFSSTVDINPDHIFYKYLKIAQDEGVKTIITAASKIETFGKQIKEYGLNWIHKVTTMRHAISGEKMGADAVILTGLEGGGLKSPNQNTFLVNMVNAKKLINIPVIASGGLSDGKSILAALVLGAEGVHMCTAFLATFESPIPDSWKEKIIAANCFDSKFIQKIYHFEKPEPKYVNMSMAVGTINKIITVKEFINNIINEAEILVKKLCNNK